MAIAPSPTADEIPAKAVKRTSPEAKMGPQSFSGE